MAKFKADDKVIITFGPYKGTVCRVLRAERCALMSADKVYLCLWDNSALHYGWHFADGVEMAEIRNFKTGDKVVITRGSAKGTTCKVDTIIHNPNSDPYRLVKWDDATYVGWYNELNFRAYGSEACYKVGDLVRINTRSGSKVDGLTGVISEVNENTNFPYLIREIDGVIRGVYTFQESDLTLIPPKKLVAGLEVLACGKRGYIAHFGRNPLVDVCVRIGGKDEWFTQEQIEVVPVFCKGDTVTVDLGKVDGTISNGLYSSQQVSVNTPYGLLVVQKDQVVQRP